MAENEYGAPVFVRIDEYKDVLDVMELIRDKITEAKDILGKITDLRNEEDAEIELWDSTISEVEKQIEHTDKMLFEPQHM